MQYLIEKRNLKLLEIIEFLNLSKTYTTHELAVHFGITEQTVNYRKRKYGVADDKIIDRIIHQLEEESIEGQTEINYKKQETCLHPHIFFKCSHCKIIFGEKDAKKIIEILKIHIKDSKNLIEQTL